MQNPVWQNAIRSSADPRRAKHVFEQLKTTEAASALRKASPEQARILAALFSGSQALNELLLKHPAWLTQALDAELLRHPRQEQGLRREVDAWLKPLIEARDFTTASVQLRLFKQREMLRIAARDLARLGNVTEITRLTPEGTLYRIDLRLRPEGDAGPLARSLGSYENYYAQWGQTWERMMLIKARRVAGDESLASEFFEMVQPFRYPRSLGEWILC